MKRLLLCLALLSGAAFAQNPTLQWERNINGNSSSDDYPKKSVMDGLGNVYIVGHFPGNTIFLIKYDNNGNQIYKTTYFGPGIGSAGPMDLVVDNSGNAYVAGSTYDSGNGMEAGLVVKFDPQGVKLWEHTSAYAYNNIYFNTFSGISFDNPSNPTAVYAAGNVNDSSLIEKLNLQTGAATWSKMLEPGKLLKVKNDNNGNPLICGITRATYTTTGEDGYIAKITSNGALVWRQTFNGTSDSTDAGLDIAPLSSGGLMVAGSIINVAGSGKPWVKFMRLNVAGQQMWGYDLNFASYEDHKFTAMTLNNAQTLAYLTYDATETCCGFKTITFAQCWDMSGAQQYYNAFYNPPAQVTTSSDIKVDNFGNPYVLGKTTDGTGLPVGYVWKLNSLGTSKDTGFYNTFGISNACNLHLDNAGRPYATFRVMAYSGDVVLVKYTNACVQDWEVIYDGRDNYPDRTTGLVTDNAGNAYVAGQIVNGMTYNEVLTRYDAAGNIVWQNNTPGFGGPLVIDAQANVYLLNCNNPSTVTAYDSAGNQFVSAPLPIYATQLQLGPSNNRYLAGGSDLSPLPPGVMSRDFSFAITDLTGVLLGSSTVTSTPGFITKPASMALDPNANTFVAGVITNFSHNNANVLVQKFNNAAQSTWYYVVPGIDSSAFDQAQVANVLYNAGDGQMYVVASGVPQGGTSSAIQLLKIDPNTNSVITYTYNSFGSTSYLANSAALGNSNEIYITGRYGGMSGFGIFVQKWDNQGNLIWERNFADNPFGNSPYAGGNAITVDASGNIYATGFLQVSTVYGNEYTFTVKLDPMGNTLWTQSYPGPIANGYGRGYYISATNNARVFVAGTAQTGPYSGYNIDISLLKYCDMPDPQLSTSGSINICSSNPYTIAAPAASYYQWSNAATSQVITVNTSGSYYCTVTENDGCWKTTDTLQVNVIGTPATPDICMVTVDDSSKHNLVIWDKTAYLNTGVIGFNIYREDLTNIYHQVGSVPIGSLSEFTDYDPVANPNTNTKRYKLTAVDSCGNESQMSNYHNTIYIVSNGSGQFSWNLLYTIENSANPVAQYILLRDDYNTNNWHAVDSTAGTQFNINDLNFATFQPTANWRVATQWNIQCTPTARTGNGNSIQATIVKSKSNIQNNRVVSVGSLNEKNVIAYPNPAQNLLTVNFPASAHTGIALINLLGENVYTSIASGSKEQIDLSKLAPGTYLLQVSNEQGKFVKRIVKE